MNNEKFESFIDDRFSSLKNLTLYIQDLEYTSYDLKQLKDYLRIAILEKAKENVRIIKEDSFIETFFLMHSISLENLKLILDFS